MAIRCTNCGENKEGYLELSYDRSLNGIVYCTCLSCRYKFVAQDGDNSVIGKYISERGKFFTALETAKFNKSYEVSNEELKRLVSIYSTVAEIDPIYHWYKIELITKNFSDYTNIKEAEKEFLKIPANDCYFVDKGDAKRHEQYRRQYQIYIDKIHEKLKKRKIKIICSVVAFILAVVAGAVSFLMLFKPVVKDSETGISFNVTNGSFGVFKKFGVSANVKSLTEQTPAYNVIRDALSEETDLFVAYDLSILCNGEEVQPNKEIEISVPVSANLHKESVVVFHIENNGNVTKLDSSVSATGSHVTFMTDHFSLFAVAEIPFKITLNKNNGETEVVKVRWGESLPRPQDPEKKGYDFVGWYEGNNAFNFSNTIIENKTLTANYTPKNYNVTYYVDGEVYGSDKATYGEDFEFASLVKIGYDIQCRENNKPFEAGNWLLDRDVNLDVKWVPKTYTVNLENDFSVCCEAVSGGLSSVTAVYDSALSKISLPVRTGYIFEGYFTQPDGQGKQYYSSAGSGLSDWTETSVETLYAKWTLDPVYTGYTYISTVEELKKLSENINGRYLLVNDINLQGEAWTIISSFNGTFDGGCHLIYNFSVTSSAYYTESERAIGLFGQLLTGGTFKNLQIGKVGSTTKVECKPWQQHVHAGMIAGYSSGNIENCKVINCTIEVEVSAQEGKVSNTEFAGNVGGICGVLRNGSVSRCYVMGCTLKSETWSKYNKISNVARCGGIVGYADATTVKDCLVDNNIISTNAATKNSDKEWGNPSGQPFAEAGGAIGHAVNMTIMQVVVFSNNSVTSIKSAGPCSSGAGAEYKGCVIGYTSGTAPTNLIGVNTSLNCSGSNTNYPGFKRITDDSFVTLLETDSAFDNGYWVSENGVISLNFYD